MHDVGLVQPQGSKNRIVHFFWYIFYRVLSRKTVAFLICRFRNEEESARQAVYYGKQSSYTLLGTIHVHQGGGLVCDYKGLKRYEIQFNKVLRRIIDHDPQKSTKIIKD
jgi:hypothetical protein